MFYGLDDDGCAVVEVGKDGESGVSLGVPVGVEGGIDVGISIERTGPFEYESL